MNGPDGTLGEEYTVQHCSSILKEWLDPFITIYADKMTESAANIVSQFLKSDKSSLENHNLQTNQKKHKRISNSCLEMSLTPNQGEPGT